MEQELLPNKASLLTVYTPAQSPGFFCPAADARHTKQSGLHHVGRGARSRVLVHADADIVDDAVPWMRVAGRWLTTFFRSVCVNNRLHLPVVLKLV
jgi:hypothetical protein